jgi:signal transduction histidine kinase
LIATEAIAIAALFGLQRQREEEFFQQKLIQYEQAYQVSLDAYGLVAQTLHDEIINRPDVIGIFQQADTATPAEQAVLRAQLLEKLNPTYENLKALNLKQLHFHLPDSTSFLRFHRPEKFGDPLIDIRYSVKLANTALTPVQGFEEGRIYNGFRYVFPLFANDGSRRHIGSVETSMSFQALRDRLEQHSSSHHALLLRRTVVDAKVQGDEKQGNYIDSDLSPDFVTEANQTEIAEFRFSQDYDAELIAAINQQIRDRVQSKIAQNQPFVIAIRSPRRASMNRAEQHHEFPHDLAAFLPLKNLKGEVVAYLVSYEPSRIIAQYRNSFYIQAAGVTISIFLFVAFIFANNRSKILLQQQKAEIEQSFQQLKETQSQLVHSEKMASLGQLVGGIAHEINNPVSFIYGNSVHAENYAHELFHLIDLYQSNQNGHCPVIEAELEELDLDFVRSDLFKLIGSMKYGAERIKHIVASLRNFSHLDEAGIKLVNIHEGLESTLTILENKLHQQAQRPAIALHREYSQLPEIECYPGDLNQTFLSILSNAIDAFEPWESFPPHHVPQIWIQTYSIAPITTAQSAVAIGIQIKDNGKGITEDNLSKIFDPFFTTKPIGQATGLGLSVSYKIIVERHHGKLEARSRPGQGTAIRIELPTKLQKVA